MFKVELELKTIMYEKGVDIIRFVDISELSSEQTQGFTKAIVFSLVLSKKFITDIYNNINVEQDEYLEKDKKVNEIAEWLAAYIQKKGYNAYAQSENNNLHNGNYDKITKTSSLPHKTIARLAGLGFIGKNNLLVTEDYGCAFCMCTVLTDAPILVEKYPLIPSNCGSCDICKGICPSKAIHGNEWTRSGGRESLIDVFKCSCPLKCMVNCPWTLKYAGTHTKIGDIHS